MTRSVAAYSRRVFAVMSGWVRNVSIAHVSAPAIGAAVGRARRALVEEAGAEDLLGAGGGLVEHAPEHALADRDLAALPEALEAGDRQRAGVVVMLAAPA